LEEKIKEMAQAGYGCWKPTKEMIGTQSGLVTRKSWTRLGQTIKANETVFEVRKIEDGDITIYKVGEFVCGSNTDDERVFNVVCTLELKRNRATEHRFKQSMIYNVDGVIVKKSLRGNKIALKLYIIIVKQEGLVILGDELQYFGARVMWARFSHHLELIVDIINIETGKYLERSVVLEHGEEDWEFDERVWSYDTDKNDIRLLLRDIKKK